MSSDTWLVTGATGFIGRQLVARLGERPVARWSSSAVDLTDPAAVSAAMAEVNPATIIHLAAAGVTAANDASSIAQNLRMTENLANAAPDGCVLVAAGSMAEYGHAGTLAEDDPCTPNTAYGEGKLAATRHLLDTAQSRRLHVRVARLFGVYGAGENPKRLFPSLIHSLRTGEPVALSDGLQARDFIHVHDVCDALIALAQLQGSSPILVNLGTGAPVTVKDTAQWLADALGADRSLLQFGARARSPGDADLLCANVDRLRATLGYVPAQRLQPGLDVGALFDLD